MPKNKESTARISMFHKLKIPFVFTLEASFAGASMGKLSGQHFSIGDLQKVGPCVLKAIWEMKKLMTNKSLLKEVSAQAQLQAKNSNDDEQDSDGCSSEEEDELPASSATAKKVLEGIIEEQTPLPGIKKSSNNFVHRSQGGDENENDSVTPKAAYNRTYNNNKDNNSIEI